MDFERCRLTSYPDALDSETQPLLGTRAGLHLAAHRPSQAKGIRSCQPHPASRFRHQDTICHSEQRQGCGAGSFEYWSTSIRPENRNRGQNHYGAHVATRYLRATMIVPGVELRALLPEPRERLSNETRFTLPRHQLARIDASSVILQHRQHPRSLECCLP